nr:hypothetical protein CFP56_24544 [Quercus suber]
MSLYFSQRGWGENGGSRLLVRGHIEVFVSHLAFFLGSSFLLGKVCFDQSASGVPLISRESHAVLSHSKRQHALCRRGTDHQHGEHDLHRTQTHQTLPRLALQICFGNEIMVGDRGVADVLADQHVLEQVDEEDATSRGDEGVEEQKYTRARPPRREDEKKAYRDGSSKAKEREDATDPSVRGNALVDVGRTGGQVATSQRGQELIDEGKAGDDGWKGAATAVGMSISNCMCSHSRPALLWPRDGHARLLPVLVALFSPTASHVFPATRASQHVCTATHHLGGFPWTRPEAKACQHDDDERRPRGAPTACSVDASKRSKKNQTRRHWTCKSGARHVLILLVECHRAQVD